MEKRYKATIKITTGAGKDTLKESPKAIKGTMCQLVNGKVKKLINIEICSSTG